MNDLVVVLFIRHPAGRRLSAYAKPLKKWVPSSEQSCSIRCDGRLVVLVRTRVVCTYLREKHTKPAREV